MPVKKAPQQEISKIRHTLSAAQAETTTERRLKQEIADTAAKFPGSSRTQCQKLSDIVGNLFVELELAMLEPATCIHCGHDLENGGRQ
ncbi:hypothetical protein [Methylomonas sp. UP202]|uniref:hypothetical protein n=1 Tax=Methylomonas sp. UP202 TaxID=3040943 RepID=UPI00247B0BC2|nr:hypothetical protein [Methylomonas sp. UP202]WGS84323.1 hypothetical protein QC632_14830 [Methylomonas sp. UP202]WGS86639.1 hypothetical protein QC632_02510 [Methylomonas sp. UP202]